MIILRFVLGVLQTDLQVGMFLKVIIRFVAPGDSECADHVDEVTIFKETVQMDSVGVVEVQRHDNQET